MEFAPVLHRFNSTSAAGMKQRAGTLLTLEVEDESESRNTQKRQDNLTQGKIVEMKGKKIFNKWND